MGVWDVRCMPVDEQFDYWREVICRAFVPLAPSRGSAGPGFAATVETRPLVELNRARIFSQPQTTRHGPREVAATAEGYYFVNLQLQGRCHTRQGGTDTVVEPGQFVVVDTASPYYFDFDAEWRMVSFRVPHRHLDARLSGRPPRVGVPVDGTGVGGAVTSLMAALWGVDENAGPLVMRDLEDAFASAVAAAVGSGPPGPPVADRAATRAAVMQHVRDHLADRTLSVTSVCRRLAISPRTLHNLFADAEQSFAATVRTLRLQRCAALLADPGFAGSITEIATTHGFDDPTSFSRAFRREFGLSPREVRRAAGRG